ncbi:MAG TPA: hypothetical protein VK676_07690 [Steroidobacteraceae bacterium]|jgi:hypothetical protein|nr:hypothetical protein [Steroidobacteraceae bacterium]
MSDYIEPEASTSAVTVIDQGNFSGMRCHFDTSLVCGAVLSAVDGKFVAPLHHQHRLTPGPHQIRLRCLHWHGTALAAGTVFVLAPGVVVDPQATGGFQTDWHLLQGTVEPGKTYYVRGALEADACKAWIADSPDGVPLPAFAVSY